MLSKKRLFQCDGDADAGRISSIWIVFIPSCSIF